MILFPSCVSAFSNKENVGFYYQGWRIAKVKKHDLLKLNHVIEATMLSRDIRGLFPYCKFKPDVSPSLGL